MKIILGSKSRDKQNILRKALEGLHVEAEVVGVDVESEITDQPLDKDITLTGARNRASNARIKMPESEFWIGLEGGLHDYGEGFHLVTYACLIDQSGEEFMGEGIEIHLPDKVSEEVKNGSWFGDAIRVYAENYEIDQNLVTREAPFTQAIQNAYANFLKAKGNLGFRKKSIAFIFNDQNEFLLVQLQSYGPDHWNMPGGGIDEGETEEQAVKRELLEELGSDKFEIVEKSDIKNQYDWPDFVIVRRLIKEGKTYKGQEQTQFIIKFTGQKEELKFQEEEIRDHKWVKYEDLEQYLIFEKQWEGFKEVIEKAKIFKL